MNILFCLAREEDTELAISIQNEAFFDDFKRYGFCSSYDRDFEQMKWIIKHNEKRSSSICYYDYLILENDMPVGNMILKDRGNGEYHLSSLCIITSHRSKGIGSKALQFIESEFKDCKVISVETPADKDENIFFYWKNGFQVIELISSHGISCALLEKKLK